MLPKDKPIITTPVREIRMIEAKQQQRQAMREFYIKERSNPFRSMAHPGVGIISDPAIVRLEASRAFMSVMKHFTPNATNAAYFFGLVIAPIVAIGLFSESVRGNFDRRCRQGEIAYADRMNKFA